MNVKEPPLYSHAWVQERAQRGLQAFKDGEVEVVWEVLDALSEYEPEPLVGAKEAAEILGTTSRALAVYRQRGLVPEPVAQLACGPIWHRETIEEWAASRAAA